jgi:DNA-binding NtrC family response regulator
VQLNADVRCAIWSEVNMLISGGDSVERREVARLIHEWTHPRGHAEFVEVTADTRGAVQLQRVRAFLERGIAGTVFFDEAADFDRRTQQRLLPILPSSLDTAVRVIAATGVDLFERVQKAAFCPDLFYRLNSIHLVLEPRAFLVHA